jgi:dihydrolipoamide dehydrogenase
MGSSKKPHKFSADAIIIGSGAGGSVAAQTLVNDGKKVVLIEEDKIGGDCANYSCVPTKALLESAILSRAISEASRHGITTGKVALHYKDALHWQKKTIDSTGVTKSEDALFRHPNIHVVKGRAHFIDAYTVSVNLTRYTSPTIIIASGSSPNIPAIEGLANTNYVTYRTFSQQKNLPKSIAIIGGGSTGYEYAQIYAAFGVTVHIFESHYHLFSSFDSEVGDLAESSLQDWGVRVHTSAKITKVHTATKNTIVSFTKNDQEHHLSVESVFVAAGHTPNTDIGLENASITYSDEGIRVNKRLQTSQKHIFAIGDVNGTNHSASSAIRQGLVAAHNITHRKKVVFESHAVPRVCYGLPEVVVVGKTEREMKLTGLPYQTSIAPLGIIGRSHTSAYASGFVKIVASHTGVIIGASIVSPQASEFASELTFAIQHHRRACDISNTIHPFSSWSDAVRVAASKIYCI